MAYNRRMFVIIDKSDIVKQDKIRDTATKAAFDLR
jgi:hypothetical protein